MQRAQLNLGEETFWVLLTSVRGRKRQVTLLTPDLQRKEDTRQASRKAGRKFQLAAAKKYQPRRQHNAHHTLMTSPAQQASHPGSLPTLQGRHPR